MGYEGVVRGGVGWFRVIGWVDVNGMRLYGHSVHLGLGLLSFYRWARVKEVMGAED